MDVRSEMSCIRQRGLYFEELEAGQIYLHAPGRTVGESDNTLFSCLTMNPQSLHLDGAAAEETEFGERIVNSLFILSTLVGLSIAQLTQTTTVANLGFETVNFPLPVKHGDTIYAESEVTEKRQSRSRPNAGIVTFEHRARNQAGDIVASATRKALMLRQSSKVAC